MPDYVEGYGYCPIRAANRKAWYNYYIGCGVNQMKASELSHKKAHKPFNKDDNK